MKNKNTTVIGILMLLGAVATGAAMLMSGQADLATVIAGVIAALGGAGFIATTDGGP